MNICSCEKFCKILFSFFKITLCLNDKYCHRRNYNVGFVCRPIVGEQMKVNIIRYYKLLLNIININ